MPKITIIATLKAAPGKEDEVADGLVELIGAADEEPGLLIYSVHRDPEDPSTFVFFELYENDEAFAVHGKGDQMRTAMGAMGALLAGRPEVTTLVPHAAKGLDI